MEQDFPDGQLQYYDLSGSPISFGVGRTYVVIVPLDCGSPLNKVRGPAEAINKPSC